MSTEVLIQKLNFFPTR